MQRSERAKQFMAFDAMKGLQEALRIREEIHSRVEHRILAEEVRMEISCTLGRLMPGDTVSVFYYACFHEKTRTGTVTELNTVYRYLKIEEERILFEDIYHIAIL